MHSYAELEIKRTSVNYSFAESFACIQMRMRNRVRLVIIFPLVREELKTVETGTVLNCVLYND